MKIAAYTKNGQLKHSHDCAAAFGRKDRECPRCVELLNGAPPRQGWQKPYFSYIALLKKHGYTWMQNHKLQCDICAGTAKGVCNGDDEEEVSI